MKSIIIIGAGMGGLAAGIYGQLNGYHTEIFESHTVPGGQCASWKRGGYTFDACIHHLMGCKEGFNINGLWRELGAMPRQMISQNENVAFIDFKGNVISKYYDLKKMHEQMTAIAPEDRRAINKYVEAIRSFAGKDIMGAMITGGMFAMARYIPALLKNLKYMNQSLGGYADRFKNPFLKRAVALSEYSLPDIPAGVHFIKHAAGVSGDIMWPAGGSAEFSKSIADKYISLGGRIQFGKKVEKILAEDDRAVSMSRADNSVKANSTARAVGVCLDDGSEHFADIVISNADGRKTIFNMLGGRYKDSEIDNWAKPGADEVNWGTMVYLGVDRDLSREPSALVMLFDEPQTLTGKDVTSLEMQIYGFDPSMSPAGKGVIKIEMVTPFSYWDCASDDEYRDKKEKTAEQVIAIMERYFSGISAQVEVVDVVTVKTWERFMGGTRGFANMPNKPFGVGTILGPVRYTLPGLDNFYMAGAWVTATGALFSNAMSGKNVIKAICRRDGIRFRTGL